MFLQMSNIEHTDLAEEVHNAVSKETLHGML